MEAIEQYFNVVLFTMPNKVITTNLSVDKNWCATFISKAVDDIRKLKENPLILTLNTI